jgi:hypothetical protein
MPKLAYFAFPRKSLLATEETGPRKLFPEDYSQERTLLLGD